MTSSLSAVVVARDLDELPGAPTERCDDLTPAEGVLWRPLVGQVIRWRDAPHFVHAVTFYRSSGAAKRSSVVLEAT